MFIVSFRPCAALIDFNFLSQFPIDTQMRKESLAVPLDDACIFQDVLTTCEAFQIVAESSN